MDACANKRKSARISWSRSLEATWHSTHEKQRRQHDRYDRHGQNQADLLSVVIDIPSVFSMIDFILIILPTAWLLYLIFSFVANYRRVIKLKLPIIPSPINPLSPLWMIAQKYIGPICHALPFHLGSFIGYNRTGWEYHEQLKLHLELGDAWVYVSTGKNQLMIADAEAIEDILSRRQDFQKPVFLYRQSKNSYNSDISL